MIKKTSVSRSLAFDSDVHIASFNRTTAMFRYRKITSTIFLSLALLSMTILLLTISNEIKNQEIPIRGVRETNRHVNQKNENYDQVSSPMRMNDEPRNVFVHKYDDSGYNVSDVLSDPTLEDKRDTVKKVVD